MAKHGPSILTLHYSQTNLPSYTQSKKQTVLNALATHKRMNEYIYLTTSKIKPVEITI